jgi:hypothetical protein
MINKSVTEEKKTNVLQRFLEDIDADKKAKILSRKVSSSFCLKKG